MSPNEQERDRELHKSCLSHEVALGCQALIDGLLNGGDLPRGIAQMKETLQKVEKAQSHEFVNAHLASLYPQLSYIAELDKAVQELTRLTKGCIPNFALSMAEIEAMVKAPYPLEMALKKWSWENRALRGNQGLTLPEAALNLPRGMRPHAGQEVSQLLWRWWMFAEGELPRGE